MANTLSKMIIASAIGILIAASPINAQVGGKPFSPETFFDELQKTGAKVPPAFDGKKFFDDLATRASQSKETFDPKKFF